MLKRPSTISRRGTSVAKKDAGSRVQRWAAEHTKLAAVLLFLGCLVMLILVFYFIVFSDFSGSADFIYAQF